MSRLSVVAGARVLSWLERQGVAIINVALMRDAGSAGVGIAAERRISRGDVLLSVPHQCWAPFSAQHAREKMAPSTLQAVDSFSTSVGAQGSQLADAALLAAALATSDAEYVHSLPQPDVPLLWPGSVRALLLRGSSAERATEQQAALSAALHAKLAPSVPVDLRDFMTAQALLLARAHSGDGKPLALVPGLDLLNHGPGGRAGAAVRFDTSSSAFELVALRDHAAGEEVMIDYGCEASHRLLRLYGFVPSAGGDEPASAAGTTRVDEVMLPLLPPASELEEAPPVAREAARAHREALTACGILGSSLRLLSDAAGHVTLPLADADSPAAAAALFVIRAAVDRQAQRQAEGVTACAAVLGTVGDAPGDVAIRARAALVRRLHEREADVLQAARVETLRLGSH